MGTVGCQWVLGVTVRCWVAVMGAEGSDGHGGGHQWVLRAPMGVGGC